MRAEMGYYGRKRALVAKCVATTHGVAIDAVGHALGGVKHVIGGAAGRIHILIAPERSLDVLILHGRGGCANLLTIAKAVSFTS